MEQVEQVVDVIEETLKQYNQKLASITIERDSLRQKVFQLQKEKEDILAQAKEFVQDKKSDYASQAKKYVEQQTTKFQQDLQKMQEIEQENRDLREEINDQKKKFEEIILKANKAIEEKKKQKTNLEKLQFDLQQETQINGRFRTVIANLEKTLELEEFVSFLYGGMSVSILEGNGCSASGPMIKQGQMVKSWKNRYFVLKDIFLMYFENKQNSQPLGIIKLENPKITQVEKSVLNMDFCFKLQNQGKEYYYCTEDELSRQKWIASIKDISKWW